MQFGEENHLKHTEHAILAQNPISHKQNQTFKLRWLLALSAIPLFGIVTAFGIAPQTITNQVPIETVIENVAMPEVAELGVVAPTSYWQAENVRRDDTLNSLLKRLNVRNTEAIDFLRNNQEASTFASQLRPGQPVQAETNEQGDLISLQYQPDNTSIFKVKRDSDGHYMTQTINATITTRVVIKAAVIKNSLFAATDDAGIPDQVALQLADIFSTDIDFNSDLRRGDYFKVVYEASDLNGEEIKTGQVLAAEFTNNGKTYRAVMYRNPQGQVAYYTPDGKSLHKSFLRSPVEFSRISSGFSLGRFHPILQRMRAHKGTDFAAPMGTRVKASGDAVVDFAGVKSGYGNVVVLKHANNVSTVYGHLSRFQAGLHKGMKVAQGDIIGFVGMTGLATGPHLHYEFLVSGEHRDPLTVALPNAAPIAPQYRAEFNTRSAALIAQLGLLSTSVASLD